MTINRLEFKGLHEMQEAFFIDRFGSERGGRLFEIAVHAGMAYDFDASETAALPYYIYAATVMNKLGNLASVLPPKMQSVLALPQINIKDNKVNIIAPSFWQLANIKSILTDYSDAISSQADLTKRYFGEQLRQTSMLVHQANSRSPNQISVHQDRSPTRMIFSASLSQKVAQRFAGVTGTTSHRNVPTNALIDSYLTNIGFIHSEYEVRYLRVPDE